LTVLAPLLRRIITSVAAIAAVQFPPAHADELFAGVYAHAVDTPLSFDTG
jgi:hypothetical protein